MKGIFLLYWENRVPRPLIVEIHLQIKANLWSQVCGQIKDVLTKDWTRHSVTPLYFTYDIEDTEIRICFQVGNPQELEKFVVDQIRPIDGI